MLVLANTKLAACLLASDFPAENPRTQTRNFPYISKLATLKKKLTSRKNTMEKFTLSEEQKNNLALHLMTKGLNDGQISDVFQRIKSESDYNKYLK